VVFVLSDFLDTGFEKPLRVAAKKHDLISIFISDPAEREIPSAGLLELEDAESGRRLLVDTSDRKAMALYHRSSVERGRKTREGLAAMGVDVIDVETGTPYDRPLLRFFQMRSRRLRR
jgi:uncharacterized protein (DUF58 family)